MDIQHEQMRLQSHPREYVDKSLSDFSEMDFTMSIVHAINIAKGRMRPTGRSGILESTVDKRIQWNTKAESWRPRGVKNMKRNDVLVLAILNGHWRNNPRHQYRYICEQMNIDQDSSDHIYSILDRNGNNGNRILKRIGEQLKHHPVSTNMDGYELCTFTKGEWTEDAFYKVHDGVYSVVPDITASVSEMEELLL